MKNILVTPEDLESSCLQCKTDLIFTGEYDKWDGFCETCFWQLEDETYTEEDE